MQSREPVRLSKPVERTLRKRVSYAVDFAVKSRAGTSELECNSENESEDSMDVDEWERAKRA